MTSSADTSTEAPLGMRVSRHHHKRSSSQWVPQDPVFQKIPSPMEFIRRRRIEGSRMIKPNHTFEEPRYTLDNSQKFSKNYISTTKYSLITFVPFNICHQLLTKYANIYFVMIAIMNFIPMFAAYAKWLGLLPIVFVLSTTLIKDGYEDIRRWRYDNLINKKLCHFWDREKRRFRKIQWNHLIVGDIVHISNEQEIPADLLILRCSDTGGTCFVETSNIDGETSLKQRKVLRKHLEFCGDDQEFDPAKYTDTVFCEKPDKAIYSIRAKIEFGEGGSETIRKDNMLLRGSRLRNTTWIEGIILYAGHDTKVMMNNGRAPHKISGIERKTNIFIVICILILIAMVLSGAILSWLWLSQHYSDTIPFFVWNLPKPLIEGFFNVGAFIISYQVIVPISLYITVEILKAIMIIFLSKDIDMYDPETDRPLDCRSWNIPEELGQISHVLSDKTGTLTENIMIFRNCAIDEIDYGGNSEASDQSLVNRLKTYWDEDEKLRHFFCNILINNSVVVVKTPHHDVLEVGTFESGVYSIGNTTFFDVTKDDFDVKVDRIRTNSTSITRTVRAKTSTNLSDILEEEDSQIIQTSRGESSETPINASPISFEETTSSEVMSRGVSSISRSVVNVIRRSVISPISSILPSPNNSRGNSFFQDTHHNPYEAESPDELALIQGIAPYKCVLEDRTVTHTVIQTPNGKSQRISVLLVLPFDSARKRMSVIIETRKGELILYTKGADSAILDRACSEADQEHLQHITSHVHEYSCKGLRTLCFAMRSLTRQQFNDFKQSYDFLQDVSGPDRDNLLSEKADEIEKELTILGVTGIEDRLQDGVEDTITSLRKAGMQVWVLTGDKLETAENIATACGLFSEGGEIRRIQSENDISDTNSAENFDVILSPSMVSLATKGDQQIINMLTRANSVLCYRMTPSEKSEVVKAVKKYLNGKTLAIGDGANDVPMIQSAHVGIGVAGKEGMQAVMACDFAIARFRFLKKLLLVHGHWSYDRLSLAFLYFLYKNTNSVFILFFYQFFDGYTGSYTIDPTYAVLYPIIFTSVQPVVVAVADQDWPARVLMKNPGLYEPGIRDELYTMRFFLLNVADAIWQAAVMYFGSHLCLWDTEKSGLWDFGFYLATAMMCVNCGHLALEVRNWTWIILLAFGAFFFLHFAYFLIYCFLAQPGMIDDPPTMVAIDGMATADFWFAQLLILVVAIFPRFSLKVMSNTFQKNV